MQNQEELLDLTESYLKSLVAETNDSLDIDFDSSLAFGELGIDSFRVLKIIKALEADFGNLPKTLLFENFNVDALARYFVDQHADALAVRFSKAPPAARAQDAAPIALRARTEMPAPRTLPSPAAAAPLAAVRQAPIRLLEKNLSQHPELDAIVTALFELHKNEGCVSRGTRSIAPNLFIGGARNGYFNYSRSNNIILVYAYTGPVAYFAELAAEMYAYCREQQFQLNIFGDEVIAAIDGVAFSATPFGALQRLLDIGSFTLEGGAMRRLRYQVAKFLKCGVCRTVKYQCGTEALTDRAIANVIDQWCATKTMVNPLIHIVKDEILAGTLHAQHRIFLTYLDDILQNVILVSAMCASLNGYLMDLEFYGTDMPLGGLETAIVNIIGLLAAEGCAMLSMGGTYGCRLASCAQADPEVDRILDELHKQNIFNDEGNLQFKNKFRTENKIIYLCRPVGAGSGDSVIDLIMMIADPARQTSDEENHNAGQQPLGVGMPAQVVQHHLPAGLPRSGALRDSGFNPLNIPAAAIDYDLRTDSWAQLGNAPFIARQMAHLRSQLQQAVDVNQSLAAIFPFKHFVLTESGRSADHLFCKAWPKEGVVLQNLLFPTCIYHQIDKGFTPREMAHPEVFRVDSQQAYKSNLDWGALQAYVAGDAAGIAYVCIEVSDNAAGGQPVSIVHLKQVRQLLSAHGVSLVLDATRILENAQYLVEHDAQFSSRSMWDAARDIMSYADAVIGSLAKDFCVNKGGLIATNDDKLLRVLQDLMRAEGGGLNVIDKKLIGLALRNRGQIEAAVLRRMRAVETVWHALAGAGVPVVRPVGGHCVLIDVTAIPAFRAADHPVASFLAWLYLNTGICAGAHSVGMETNGPIGKQVRLAIPVGVTAAQAADIATRLAGLFAAMSNVPQLKQAATPAGAHVHFELVACHNPSAPTAIPVAAPAEPVLETALPAAPHPSGAAARGELAIVGIAGRYPKARSITEFWENLKQGRDCVGDLPAERIAQRMQNPFSRSYRGGFLDEVDRFDSLFFNISPREAEVLDPQERLFLEVAWEALEDAGYYPENLAREDGERKVGVFVGAVWAMYQMAGVEAKLAGVDLNPNSFLWSISNRVSFWMNLTGPSLTVDTACSSSLTAMHLACEAIHNGDCVSAIVGGVNLDLHQHKFDINFNGGALSADGVCRSFGAGANGYVAGEGSGAVFIKRLDQAIADRDQIYAVIKSAAVNHGGRTSGYTVPNPKAHGDLIAAALEKAGIDARTIGYIEAHGTGTELGDPIEISGLSKAFAPYLVARQSCPIGSVKTNIGHLEAAAGVVGVCKVLLQMKHRQLVPSLHSAKLNEYIDFKNSPFYVQKRLETWAEKEVDGVRLPLRAGLSSFGAGGANAHIVFERGEQAASPVPAGVYVFPLSARNEPQLRDMAQRLRAHLRLDYIDHNLADIAFTLHHGRKPFEQRLAVLAGSAAELADKLDAYLDNKKQADVVAGHAKNADSITKLLSRKEKEQFVAMLAQGADPHKLAQLWVDGILADCRSLPQSDGRRTSLPTYPFADKRHWIGAGAGAPKVLQGHGALHPLIDSNESTFQRQLFKKTFHAREFFMRDHVVSGVPTLPGTAYLDLARKAGEIAAGRKVRKIRNVTWVSPLALDGATPLDVFVELKPAADVVNFEVFSLAVDGQKKLYAQGKLVYAADHAIEVEPEFIDLAAIRARCTSTIVAKEAYPLFDSVGMHYGPSFQVLGEVRSNEREVLGLMNIPASRGADFDDFVLHPCILDAAMQAGVMAQLGQPSGEMKVPYSIGEVELLHPLTRTCYSYMTKADGEPKAGSAVSRENLAIVDESGRVLARIRESVGVSLASVHAKPAPQAQEEAYDQLYYTHAWRPAPLAAAQNDTAALLIFDSGHGLRDACAARKIETVLVLPGERFEDLGNATFSVNPRERGDFTRLFEALAAQVGVLDKICYAWPDSAEPADDTALGKALALGVYAFLFACQGVLEQKIKGRVQMLYLHAGARAHNDAINGFVRSLRLENPKIDCKVLELGAGAPDPALVLAELDSSAQDDISVRYQDGVRCARRLERLELVAPQGGMALRQHGVYLITGGAGGLGLIFAEFLAIQCKARLVLSGRSSLSKETAARLEMLRGLGAEVLYVAADVALAEDAARLVAAAKAQFGAIDGIVHSAGVLRDSFLRKKTREEMAAVFAPKVFGTFYLDQLTRGEKLDFFVMFSSLAAVGGNAGQCDYAYANHYMDSFAEGREQRRAAGIGSGRTLSINWSLWAQGGMKLDDQTELFFKKNLGIVPLRTELGLASFINALPLAQPQIAVLEGVRSKIELAWGMTKKEAPAPRPAAVIPGDDLAALVIRELTGKVMELLKIGVDDLALDAILLDLGFDSIGLTTFANAINERYQLDINPVLFFEYPSIAAIAGVLAAEHADAVRKVHGAATPSPKAAAAPKAEQAVTLGKGWTPPAAASLSREQRFANEPIAIVGIGGVMPQSANLEQFWDNLKNARNMVTEIPAERWIWEDYDGNPVKETNKSNSRWGGFLNEVDKFDPLFFSITPREAEMMDPQQRIFLETVWSAIEDSGHKVSDLAGTRTGLFVGASAKDYIDVLAAAQAPLDGYSASGNSHSILANRVSFQLNLRGPSAPLDTACSSSLIALHRAIESIRCGSSDMAIVGGVQVMLTPIGHISLSSAGMLSIDGKCKTFDKDANGYVRGEGSGAIFIKPLSKAEQDGNPIYAVIKSSAENHGGRVTMLTAPNPKAQAELLFEAYEQAAIDPASVGYIECHGTGTSLGDPIEIQALKKAFADLYKKHGLSAPTVPHCGLSSVKTNIGHLEPAAGIASLLKVLLSMKHRQIPALLHFESLNPYIDLSGSPFYIVDKTVPWKPAIGPDGAPLPLRAGISSFGWGGANAHVVLEEYIAPSRPTPARVAQVMVLSAKSDERLKAYAAALLAHVGKHEIELADLAYTLQVGRDAMNERLALVVDSVDQLAKALRAWLAGETGIADLHRGRVARGKRIDAPTAGSSLSVLAQAWVEGAELDWRAADGARRISLPTYPFARERYWIGAAPVSKNLKPEASVSVLRSPGVGSLLATPVWEASVLPSRPMAYERHHVLLWDLQQVDLAVLQTLAPGVDATRMPMPDTGDAGERYSAAALACFGQLQAILQERRKGKTLFQVVVPNQGPDALLAGLAGLMRSARMENPRLIAQLVLADGDATTLAAQLLACGAQADEVLFRLRGQARSVQRWATQENRAATRIGFKDRGVYLITGGLGGLGTLFANEILERCPAATVVLTGRAAPDNALPAGQLVYRQLDLNRLEQVEALVKELIATYGALNGVIHSAGMTRDSFIVNKSRADFADVLAPKVGGTLNLDSATRDVGLDFMVLFSSLSAALGNAGQADYAAANGFMDQFSEYRAGLGRRGQTLSINWPLWEEGGMQVDAKGRAMLLKASGMLPMRTATGIQALHRCLELGAGQALVMEGHVERLRQLLQPAHGAAPAPLKKIHSATLRELVLADLRAFQAKGM